MADSLVVYLVTGEALGPSCQGPGGGLMTCLSYGGIRKARGQEEMFLLPPLLPPYRSS